VVAVVAGAVVTGAAVVVVSSPPQAAATIATISRTARIPATMNRFFIDPLSF
jgi:hypothetical protein